MAEKWFLEEAISRKEVILRWRVQTRLAMKPDKILSHMDKQPPSVYILAETAYIPPPCGSSILFLPKPIWILAFTMVGENFESCTSQIPRNASKLSRYVKIKWLIDW